MRVDISRVTIGASLQGGKPWREMGDWICLLHSIGITHYEIPPIPITMVPSIRRLILSKNCKIVALHGAKSFFDAPIAVWELQYRYYLQLCSLLDIKQIVLHPPSKISGVEAIAGNFPVSSDVSILIETTSPYTFHFQQFLEVKGICCGFAFDVSHLARSYSKAMSLPVLDAYYLHVRGWRANERYTLFNKRPESVWPWIHQLLVQKKPITLMLEYPYQDLNEVSADLNCLQDYLMG